MSSKVTGSAKVYGWLLRMYPARFREEYQGPMERQFSDESWDSHGRADRIRLWLRALRDLAASVPAQTFAEFRLDLKHAVRIYRARSLSTTLAVLALGLAIGSGTGVFGVLSALLLRTLPFANPDQLTELWLAPMNAMQGRAAFTAWHQDSPYLQSAATFSCSDMNLTGGRDALRVRVAETSANLFQLLGVAPVAGRTFAPDEDMSGHNAVAVIGYSLWQQLFGGNPDLRGLSLHVNGTRVSVIGVASPAFDYPEKAAIWLPTAFDFEKVPKRGAFLFRTIGRLKPHIAFGTAREMFTAEVRRSSPASLSPPSGDEENRPHLVSFRNQLAGPVRQAAWVLAGLSLLVLLTACANVAQLLLSRTTERREELDLRAALGASRARLLQQLVTEATCLTMAGAALGLIVAYWVSAIASALAPPQLTTQQYTVLDWRVLAFATGVAHLTGLVFGVLPAVMVGRLQPSGTVVRTQAGAGNNGTRRLRAGLLAVQAALTLLLVTTSWSMGRTFLTLLHADLGFQPSNVVTLNVSLQGSGYRGSEEWSYYSEALRRLRSIPGVQSAGAVSYLPLADSVYMANAFTLDSGQKVGHVVTNAVTPGYFRAVETPFIAGHDFEERAGRHAESTVIVNEAFAQSTGLGQGIVGRHLIANWRKAPYLIAGVVGTARWSGPAYPGGAQIFWPVEEEPPASLTFVARVPGNPEEWLARCRDAVRSVNTQVPVYDVTTLDRRLSQVLSRPRLYTLATLFLALLAVVLAAAGSYGAAAYAISQRRRELGVRMAVGASYRRVRRMVLQESLRPVAAGAFAGVLLSVAGDRYLEHLIESAAGSSFLTSAGSAVFLVLTGFCAVWSATRRVLGIDPATALRAE